MALITSDCDAMRTHDHQMALITSGVRRPPDRERRVVRRPARVVIPLDLHGLPPAGDPASSHELHHVQGEMPRLTAAVPMENPYCSCKLTRVPAARRSPPTSEPAQPGCRRTTGTPSAWPTRPPGAAIRARRDPRNLACEAFTLRLRGSICLLAAAPRYSCSSHCCCCSFCSFCLCVCMPICLSPSLSHSSGFRRPSGRLGSGTPATLRSRPANPRPTVWSGCERERHPQSCERERHPQAPPPRLASFRGWPCTARHRTQASVRGAGSRGGSA